MWAWLCSAKNKPGPGNGGHRRSCRFSNCLSCSHPGCHLFVILDTTVRLWGDLEIRDTLWWPPAEQVVAPLAKCGSRVRGFAPYQ